MKSRRLRELILAPETLIMPDAFDPLSARVIERLGFPAVQCSGFSMALAAMRPTEADLGLEANVALTHAIAAAVQVPVMADGEDGFGDAAGVPATVRAYVAAGAAGVNLEDQVLAQPGPKRVVPCEEMVAKLKAARAAARNAGNADLVINGRTDALTMGTDRQAGLREAAARANAYLAAGADLAFVVGVTSMEEVRYLLQELKGPLSIAAGMPYNLRSLPLADLRAAGVARVSLPVVAVLAALT
ncbi:MAG: isocitrate lyase/PEP mutase family protein [Lentisphaerae bacterium]|nr:isocitrate lyase/PEP mutase family protein [Lentisphaerota bacterium]